MVAAVFKLVSVLCMVTREMTRFADQCGQGGADLKLGPARMFA
jgi:hypothetical protein